MAQGEIVIAKVWRSELPLLCLFALLSIASIVLSRLMPWSVVHGEVVPVPGGRLMLDLPLFWLLASLPLGMAMYRVYNVRYSMNSRFVEARIGVLAFTQKLIRIRYEDIRGVESEQSLLERFLDVGTLEIGTSASGNMEMIMRGVAAPREVQEVLQNERDRRQSSRKRQKPAPSDAEIKEQANA